MPSYQQVTLDSLITEISTLLDDPTQVYWVPEEIKLAIFEALRVWGALTSYWRSRGTFNLDPSQATPWYDLGEIFAAGATFPFRTRSTTLDQLTREIQYMSLEAANGISGAGMSGQITISSILQALQRARNRFVLDAHFPLSLATLFGGPPPPEGIFQFSESAVFVHRVGWQDYPGGVGSGAGGQWANLWREDSWSMDKGFSGLQGLTPGLPASYSEASLAPLQFEILPIPQNEGSAEALIVASKRLDLADPLSLFSVPDEWAHAVKYAALSDLYSAESQNKDPLRAQYAEMRYQQAIAFAKDARSIIRLAANGQPLITDSLAALDAGSCYWRNQTGPPQSAGLAYDWIGINPGVPSSASSITADVVAVAPLPVLGGDFLPLGQEELDNIIDYVTHVLTFKCGGQEFTGTFPGYDSFLQSVAGRNSINAAKVRYLTPLFATPQQEWQRRPDQLEKRSQ